MIGNLNARQVRLAKVLLSTKRTTAKVLATMLRVSTKTVYSDLKLLTPLFLDNRITIQSKPRIGIVLDGQSSDFKRLTEKLANTNDSEDERMRTLTILLILLERDQYLSLTYFSERLFLGEKTVERSLRQLNSQLEKDGVHIERRVGQGFKLIATEKQKRQIFFKVLNQYWGDQWRVNASEHGNQVEFRNTINGLSLPDEVVDQLLSIVSKFIEKQQLQFSDYAYQSLVIHLAIAIQRIKQGHAIQDPDMAAAIVGDQQLNNATKLAEQIGQALHIQLPKAEIRYIQIHLAAADIGSIDLSKGKKNSMVLKLLRKELRSFGFDSELLSGLDVHLESAINRLKVGATIANPYTEEIKRNFTQAFDQALRLAETFERQYNIKMSDDEVAYIALHLEAYIERKRTPSDQLNVALVCSTGLGSAQLLAAKVRREFPELHIVGTWSLQELSRHSLNNVDFIISTIAITNATVPTIIVSPIMDTGEETLIKQAIENKAHADSKQTMSLIDLLDERFIFMDGRQSSYQNIIRYIGERLIREEAAVPGVIEAALQREELSYTSFQHYAVPHADPKFLKHNLVAIYVSDEPVQWGNYDVSIVFFLGITRTLTQSQVDSVFDGFYDVISDQRVLDKLINAKTKRQVIDRIEEVVNH
jgi:transcriptional antiterminator